MACVLTTSDEFRQLSKSLNIAPPYLEAAIKEYMDSRNLEETPYESDEMRAFLSNRFSNNILVSVSNDMLEEATTIVNAYNNTEFPSINLAKAAADIINSILDSNVATVYETTEGKFKVVSGTVISSTTSSSSEEATILKNTPKDNSGNLLAPNGKVSHLTPIQYAQVRTKAFKDWFGDWENDPENASKVVDENGEPLVVYHSTKASFSEFKYVHDYSVGHFFTSDKEYSKHFGNTTLGVFLKLSNPITTEVPLVSSNIEEVYAKSSTIENVDGIIGHDLKTPEFTPSKGTEYVVYDSNQIKSATDNDGEYSVNNDNIYHEHSTITNGAIDPSLKSLPHKKGKVTEAGEYLKGLTEASPYYHLAQYLLGKFGDTINAIPIIPIKHIESGTARAIYRVDEQGNGKIYIDPDAQYSNGDATSVLIHEILHPLTINKILNDKATREAFTKIMDQYDKYHTGRNKYALSNHAIEEFVADLWSDPDLISELNTIPATSREFGNLIDQIIEFLNNILTEIVGIELNRDSLLYEASVELNTLLSNNFRRGDSTIIARDNGIINNNIYKEGSDIEVQEQHTKRRNVLHNSKIISAEKRHFLTDYIARLASRTLTNLIEDSSFRNNFMQGQYRDSNFDKMDRGQVLRIVTIENLLDYVKNTYFDPDGDTMDDNRFMYYLDHPEQADDLRLIRDNWEAAISEGYSMLIALEQVKLENTFIEDVNVSATEGDEYSDELKSDIEGLAEDKEREYWQTSFRQQSAMLGLSGRIRRFLNSLFEMEIMRDSDGNILKDESGNPRMAHVKDKYGYGFDTFINAADACNKMLEWFQNCSTIEQMEAKLREHEGSETWVTSVLGEITKEPFRSEFFTNFRKDKTIYTTVKIDKDPITGQKQYSLYTVNTKGVVKQVVEEIQSYYSLGMMDNIFTGTPGNLSIGKVKKDACISIYNELGGLIKRLTSVYELRDKQSGYDNIKDKIIPVLQKNLKELGFRVDSKLVDSLLSEKLPSDIRASRLYKVVSQSRYLLNTLIKNSANDQYDPMGRNGVLSNYRSITTELGAFIQDSIENSVFEGGKMYYTFCTPSYMGQLAKDLENAYDPDGDFSEDEYQDYLQNNFGKYRWFKEGSEWRNTWLQQLATDKKARQLFRHTTLLTFDKTPYVDLSEYGYTMSLMSSFFADPNELYAYYRLPMLSNKPSSEFIRFIRYSGSNYKNDILKGLRMTVGQEISRIKAVIERATNPFTSTISTFDISDKFKRNHPEFIAKATNKSLEASDFVNADGELILLDSGASFKFIDALNNEFRGRVGSDGNYVVSTLCQMIIDKINGVTINEDLFQDLLDKKLTSWMDNMLESNMEEWRRIGILDKDPSTKTYKDVLFAGKSDEEVNYMLENYLWNDVLATINIIELTTTDLAYYKSAEDFQKRFAEVHAPTMKMNINATDANGNKYSDGTARTILIADEIVSSEIIPNVEIVFDQLIAKQNNPADKQKLRDMKKDIIEAFKDINVTDAQAFTSITGYRKKLGMMGRFDAASEQAYQRILDGNFDVSDLNVVWQPLKPFAYSQMTKPGECETFSEIKVPTQQKNSEYLILLAGAIAKHSLSKSNKLAALYDFMENSAYDGRESVYNESTGRYEVRNRGIYNTRGIDSIQFVSASKVGTQGVIDLTGNLSYSDIMRILEESAYMTDENGNRTGEYNANVVHSFSFLDYGIQQEVPAHLQDHSQQMGSQMRILSISDYEAPTIRIKGEDVNFKEVRNEYFNLIAKNIEASFDRLAQEFNITGTRAERNIAMSTMLRNAMQGDSKYGRNLLDACDLDENFEFNIPLFDPIQGRQIQELINSLIKTRINKQKMPGGPIVQATSWGLSEDLNIVFQDAEGNTVSSFKEWCASKGYTVTSESVREKYFKEYETEMYDKQYAPKEFEAYCTFPSTDLERLMTRSDGSIMTPDEAIAVGIPEEVFLAIGQRTPTEGKYSMQPIRIKGFLPRSAGEVIMLPKEITLLTGSDFDIDKVYIEYKSFSYNWKSVNDDKVADAYQSFMLNHREFKTPVSRDRIIEIVHDIEDNGKKLNQFTEDTSDYRAAKWWRDHMKSLYDLSINEATGDNINGRTNRIFDIQRAVLTSPSVASQMFNPGGFEAQKRTSRMVRIAKKGLGYTYSDLQNMSDAQMKEILGNDRQNLVNPVTQVKFHKQNMIAGKMIGIFANNNTAHAFCNIEGITVNIPFFETGFTFNGVNIGSGTTIDGTYSIVGATENGSPIYGTEYISKTLASFLAASVDAVKDPVLNYINLNTFTAGPAMVLARLGFDSDSIGLFLSQPGIQEMSDLYFKDTADKVQTASSYTEKYKTKLDPSLSTYKRLGKAFTKEEFIEELGNPTEDYQKRVQLLFCKLMSFAKDLQTVTFMTKFNSVSNAAGPTISDNIAKEERVEKYFNKANRINPRTGRLMNLTWMSDNAADIIENNSLLKAFYHKSIDASEELFKEYFPHYSSDYRNAISAVSEFLDEDSNLSAKEIEGIINEYTLYRMSMANHPFLDCSYETRDYYINKFPKEFVEVANSHPENVLLRYINIKSDKKVPVSYLKPYTSGMKTDQKDELSAAWDNLFNTPETHDFAIKLYKYWLYRTGLSFSPKSALNLASTDMKMAIPGYTQFLNECINSPVSDPTSKVFAIQYALNHTDNRKFVPEVSEKDISIIKDDRGRTVTDADGRTLYEITNAVANVIVSDKEDGSAYVKVSDLEYVRVPIRGFKFNFLEYDSNESDILSNKSVINTLKAKNTETSTTVVSEQDYNNEDESGENPQNNEFEDLAFIENEYNILENAPIEIQDIMDRVFTDDVLKAYPVTVEEGMTTEAIIRVISDKILNDSNTSEDTKRNITKILNYIETETNRILDKSNIC